MSPEQFDRGAATAYYGNPMNQIKPTMQNNAPSTVVAQPNETPAISELAFQLYMRRGQQDGRDVEDWLEAERQLLALHS